MDMCMMIDKYHAVQSCWMLKSYKTDFRQYTRHFQIHGRCKLQNNINKRMKGFLLSLEQINSVYRVYEVFKAVQLVFILSYDA